MRGLAPGAIDPHRDSTRWRWLASAPAVLLAGVAQAMSFSPFEAWWLQLLALGVLAHATAHATVRRAALMGWLFAVGWLVAGFWWLYISMHRYGGMQPALAASAVLLLLGIVIASSVEQHFEDLDMEVLSGKMELTRQALWRVHSQEGLTEFTHQLAYSLVGHHGMEVMVIDADEAVIFATGHAGFDPALVIRQATQAPDQSAIWQLDGQTYRGLAARLPTAMADATGRPLRVFVAVAADIAHHQTFMHSFLQTLWLFVAGAALLTGVLVGNAISVTKQRSGSAKIDPLMATFNAVELMDTKSG
mgnify:CR=1 FL=1